MKRVDKKGCRAIGTLTVLLVKGNEQTTIYNNIHDTHKGRKRG